MKSLVLGFLLVIWFIFTLILTCSIIGMILFIPGSYDDKSTWMEIGADIKNKLLR